MPEQFKPEVTFNESKSGWEDKKSPELTPQAIELLETIKYNRENLLNRVYDYENAAEAPDGAYEKGKPVYNDSNEINRLGYTVINPDKFQVEFDAGLYHAQTVEVQLITDDSEESGTLIVKTALTKQEQRSAGTLLKAVNEILEEQGYKVENE